MKEIDPSKFGEELAKRASDMQVKEANYGAAQTSAFYDKLTGRIAASSKKSKDKTTRRRGC